MPLTALDKANRGKYIHGPNHDLESLLQTALGIVCFTTGPCGKVRLSTDHVPTSRWFNDVDREQLFKDKMVDLLLYDREIDQYVTEYWKPFAPYLRRLVKATWPDRTPPLSSHASHEVFKGILTEALVALKKLAEEPAKYASRVTQKRGRPSKGDEGKYPYMKFSRGLSSKRIERPIVIKDLSEWEDSVDA